MSAVLLAHGLGGRSDLPVPLWLALYGGAAAVIVSFAALGAFWREPKLLDRGRPLAFPQGVTAFADATATRVALRALGVLIWAFLVATAAFGSDSDATNPAPTLLYVWIWIGLVPLSLLLGPVWRLMNPLRAFSGVLSRMSGRREFRPLPSRLGYWPAAISLTVFVWLELVYDQASKPVTVLAFILLYSLVHVVAGHVYGEEWYSRGDGFEVYSSLLAGFSVLGRDPSGRLVLRNPFRGLASMETGPGLIAVVAVLLGSTAFDGLTRTRYWSDLTQDQTGLLYLLTGSAGLAAAILFVTVTYLLAMRMTARLVATQDDPRALAAAFIHSLIPIAIGYTIAHYFSLFVFQGQAGYIIATDPFDTGADILGTEGWTIDYLAVSTATIALVQVISIVVGHVAGVVSAHDRTLGTFRPKDRTRAQYPLLAVMVLYTVGGIALLVGT